MAVVSRLTSFMSRWLGIKWSTFMYGIIAIVGLVLFVMGGALDQFWLMLLGRLIFGLGNEIATGVSVNFCTFSWYKEIVNFASSMTTNIYLGTLTAYQMSPKLYNFLSQTLNSKMALNTVLLLDFIVYIPTFVLAVAMTFLGPSEAEDKIELTADVNDPTSLALQNPVSISAIIKFPAVFWLLCIVSILLRGMSTFHQYSQGLFTEAHGLSINDAADAITILNLTITVLTIPVSIIVYKIGRNSAFVTVGIMLSTIAHIMLASHIPPHVPMFILGIGRVLTFAMGPMYSYPLDKHVYGSCYGIVGTVSSFGLAVIPFACGAIIDNFGYNFLEYFYMTLGFLAFLCMIMVWMLDCRSTGILNMTPDQRKELKSRQSRTNIDAPLDYGAMPSM